VDKSWDGEWEAATARDASGWTAEIRIPITTLSFKRDLSEWGFNVHRRIQRRQETDRWASPRLPIFAGLKTTGRRRVKVRLNLSPDLQFNSFLQYDTESRTFGTNTRLRWTFDPRGDLFLIYNHNLREIGDRWRRDANELLVKLQYTFRR